MIEFIKYNLIYIFQCEQSIIFIRLILPSLFENETDNYCECYLIV